MGKLKIEQRVIGPVATNVYLGINTETKEAFLEIQKQEKKHRVNDREISLAVSSTCFVHIVNRQIQK